VSADDHGVWVEHGLDDVASVLFEQRVVLVSGEVDAARSSALAATLMTLDATGDRHIELRLSSCRGSIEAALALIDVVDVLGVPVHASALGTIEGGPVGVFASCEQRRIAPHAVLRLRAPDVEVTGTAKDLERALAAHETQRVGFVTAVAARVGRSYAEVDAEWEHGALLEAVDAVSLGYADAVLDPIARSRVDEA
jgi:ATP-dependent Clp protease protease subunit